MALVIACYVSYYVLLRDQACPASIAAIVNYSHRYDLTKHVMILGFLPVYIAIIIFGAATIGIYLGHVVESLLIRNTKK